MSSFDATVLANAPAGRKERRIAIAAIGLSMALFVALVPFAKQPLLQVWAFIPIYETALVATDLTTVLLLVAQAHILRSRALLVLAAGYLFSALMTVAHGLTFPGLFAPGGLLDAGPQTTAWLYMFWHGGFPLFVVAYALLRGRPSDMQPAQPWSGFVHAAVAVVVLVVLLAWIATAGHDGMPRIMQGNRYTPAMVGVVSGVWLASLLALAALWWRRTRTVLDVWLAVVMFAWLLDIALSAVLNAGRFDVGFYAGRIYGLLAASFVLGMLLIESGLLYGRLALAHRHERQRVSDLGRLKDRLEVTNGQLGDANHQLREQTRLKSEFLANMSHELRTPLNAIIGFSDLLKSGQAGEAGNQRVFAGHIFTSGEHLLSLINDILDLSKVEAGKMDVALAPVDVDLAVTEVVALLANQAKPKRIGLAVAPHVSIGTVRVDARRLKQILLNLVSNAMKFTPEGGRVTVAVKKVTRAHVEGPLPGFRDGVRLPLPANEFQEFVEFSVTDTGIGVAKGDLKALFSPFTQVSNSVTRSAEGTGLGLVMVHRLAQLHGGTVAVTSEPGRGSCFTVWLPWRDGNASQREAEPPKFAARPSGRLALVVEDDDKAAELMRHQLEAEGFSVRRVATAERALELVHEFTPDVITLDILLPGMDGWEFLQRLRQTPPWDGVPVVVVSVVADQGRGFSLGASLVLQKPVTRDALASALGRLGLAPGSERDRAVLVIDDDAAAVDLLAAHLHDLDCVVLRALGGREGIDLARRFRPELITLDLDMPGVNGFDVVEALKANASTASIPIVVVTAQELSAADRRSLNGHVLDIVSKADFNLIGEVRRAVGAAG